MISVSQWAEGYTRGEFQDPRRSTLTNLSATINGTPGGTMVARLRSAGQEPVRRGSSFVSALFSPAGHSLEVQV